MARTKIPTEANLGPLAKMPEEAARALAAKEPGGNVVRVGAEGVYAPVAGTAPADATQPLTGAQEPAKGVAGGSGKSTLATATNLAAMHAEGVAIDSTAQLRRYVVKKARKMPMTIRVPEQLYDDLQMIQKFGGRTMTDVIVEATTPLVERLMVGIGQRKE